MKQPTRKTKPRGVPQPRGFHGDRKRVAPLWVSSAEKRALEAAAKRAGISISEFIRRAVEEKIERGER
jgi:hypothetical protein